MGLLQHIQHQISAINDLVIINNDRVAGYEKAIEAIQEEDLKDEFRKCIEGSKANIVQLHEELHRLGGEPADGTSISGKVFHTWQNLKSIVSKPDTLSILSDCERGEDAAKAAYREALDDKELIWNDNDLVKLLTKQLTALKDAHDRIKGLRDAAKPVL